MSTPPCGGHGRGKRREQPDRAVARTADYRVVIMSDGATLIDRLALSLGDAMDVARRKRAVAEKVWIEQYSAGVWVRLVEVK